MLDVQDIHTYYGDSYVLQGMTLKVAPGQVVAVLGRNGVGKTTLIRSIIGFTPPRQGSIRLMDREIAGLAPEKVSSLGVGLVPQGRRIFGSLTVRENLLVGQRQVRNGHGWTIEDVFKLFPRLSERVSQSARSLSGGEQQMLACGRALVGNPHLMLMDEPTEGLSPLFVRELGTLIQTLRDRGTSVLLIEQNLGFALRLADYVYVVNKGRIVHESEPDGLSEEVRTQYLGV